MKEAYNFINELSNSNEYVIAAISGGPDSIYLLELLEQFQNKFKIVVAHVHHNLRKESDEEAEKLKAICKEKNLIFEMMKIENYPNNKFSEEIARNIRYEYFDTLIKKYNSDILFTAHHGNDQIETILMRLSRGSSLKGYAGIEQINTDRGYRIIRPLLQITKEEIIEYLDNNKLWYAVDNSNSDIKYTRNRYRKNILPELKKENKNIHKKFNEYSNRLLLADNYLKKESSKIYKKILNKNSILVNEFNELDQIIKIYVIEKYLKDIYKNDISLLNNKHIEIIINNLSLNRNVIFDLPNSKIGIIEYNNFKVIEKTIEDSYIYEFTEEVILPNNGRIYIDNNTKDTNNFVIHLNSKEIKLPFIVRTRKDGDFMIVKNMTGRKKINDIFIDSKISKEKRDTYPIVTDRDGEIIWIPGVKKSYLDRKKEQKYDIILKYSQKEE